MPVETKWITRRRLNDWAEVLEREHGTPLLLVGIGHDHNIGQLILCTVDAAEMDTAALCLYMKAALTLLENMLAKEIRAGAR